MIPLDQLLEFAGFVTITAESNARVWYELCSAEAGEGRCTMEELVRLLKLPNGSSITDAYRHPTFRNNQWVVEYETQ